MPAPGVVLIVLVVVIVVVAAAFLLPTILALSRISKALDSAAQGVGELVAKTEPVRPVLSDINANLDAGVAALEGLLVQKAGLPDAMGLIEGIYPGAAAAGLREHPNSQTVRVPRIGEVYTRGVLSLARLGRDAPIAAASPEGPVLRHVDRSEIATDSLYPNFRPKGVHELPRSPVIGKDAPVQYEPALTPGVRPSRSEDPASKEN
jgi:hypothetical protein